MKHVISDDTFSHIEDETCWCSPRICNCEGEIIYLHNSNYSLDIETEDREETNIINRYEIKSNKSN